MLQDTGWRVNPDIFPFHGLYSYLFSINTGASKIMSSLRPTYCTELLFVCFFHQLSLQSGLFTISHESCQIMDNQKEIYRYFMAELWMLYFSTSRSAKSNICRCKQLSSERSDFISMSRYNIQKKPACGVQNIFATSQNFHHSGL